MNELRVSVATYNQVVFSHPENGTTMLALERKATVLRDGTVRVLAQPFGGGVRILDPSSLMKILGDIQFDSPRSKQEQDFRILVPSSKWKAVRQYCLMHLENPDDSELEPSPQRELVEEFGETLGVDLNLAQYTVHPLGFVIEDGPVPTENADVRGRLTARLYRIFEVQITDVALCKTMLAVSRRDSDQELGRLALKDSQHGGRGRVNSVLTLPLDSVREAYLALPPEMRYRKVVVEDHELDESVLAILGDLQVPQYQKIS